MQVHKPDTKPPNRSAEKAFELARKERIEFDEFSPESDIEEGLVIATSRDPSLATLGVIADITTEDGDTYVTVVYRDEHSDSRVSKELLESFCDRVAYEDEWVVVPHTATTSGPHQCPNCGKFANVHEGQIRAFATGGCDYCNTVITHDELIDRGAAVEILI